MRADGCDPPRSSASAIHLRWDVRLSGWMTQTARESNNPTRLPFSQSASSFNTIHFDAHRRPSGAAFSMSTARAVQRPVCNAEKLIGRGALQPVTRISARFFRRPLGLHVLARRWALDCKGYSLSGGVRSQRPGARLLARVQSDGGGRLGLGKWKMALT